MPMMVLGAHMCPHLQKEAKARYVHRFTGEHTPEWARKPRSTGKPWPLQFSDDVDWLAHTYFPVTKAGKLALRPSYCQSTPTWPNNPERRKEPA